MLSNETQEMPSIFRRSPAPASNVLSFSQHSAGSVFRRTLAKNVLNNPGGAVFDPEEIALLTTAFHQACAFLDEGAMISRVRRTEIAHSIISIAGRGVRDPHRLALKAIVQAG